MTKLVLGMKCWIKSKLRLTAKFESLRVGLGVPPAHPLLPGFDSVLMLQFGEAVWRC